MKTTEEIYLESENDMKKKIEIIERIVRRLEKLKKCKKEVKK